MHNNRYVIWITSNELKQLLLSSSSTYSQIQPSFLLFINNTESTSAVT